LLFEQLTGSQKLARLPITTERVNRPWPPRSTHYVRSLCLAGPLELVWGGTASLNDAIARTEVLKFMSLPFHFIDGFFFRRLLMAHRLVKSRAMRQSRSVTGVASLGSNQHPDPDQDERTSRR